MPWNSNDDGPWGSGGSGPSNNGSPKNNNPWNNNNNIDDIIKSAKEKANSFMQVQNGVKEMYHVLLNEDDIETLFDILHRIVEVVVEY